MISDLTSKLLRFQHLKGIGPATLTTIAGFADVASVSEQEVASRNAKFAKALSERGAWDAACRRAEADERDAERTDTTIVSILDATYPALLYATSDRPAVLYIRGQLAPTPEKSVAVIGTRQPTDHGKLVGERIVEFLVGEGWSIVSGLAIGCDALAHKAALSHQGHTVAVLAHGLQMIAPKQHEQLAGDIVEAGGALVSEYGFGVTALPHQFVKRDRIQAGLAQGVVMIQSDAQGGSLHAARAAINYGRILAVPAPTERDLANLEKKAEVPHLLSGKNRQAMAALLGCDISQLDQLTIMRGKQDYPNLAALLSAGPVGPACTDAQAGFF